MRIRFLALSATMVLLVAITGGFMSDLASVISRSNETGPPTVRVGTIVATPAPSAAYASVDIDGTIHRLPFQAPYVPAPGDQVNVLWIPGSGATMSGIVLGGRSGQSGNRVLNGGFDVVNPAAGLGVPPPNWYHYRASGSAGAVTGSVQAGHDTPVMVMSATSNAASDNYAYSAAIPVQPGQSWRLDAAGFLVMVVPSMTFELRALWFNDDQALMPDTVAASSLADSSIAAAGGIDWGLGNNSITVPASVSFMRVAIRVIHDAGPGGTYTIHVANVQAYRN